MPTIMHGGGGVMEFVLQPQDMGTLQHSSVLMFCRHVAANHMRLTSVTQAL